MNTSGWIYCVSNPWYLKNLYKIGFTEEENPFKRISELSSHTGIPVPFEVKFLYISPREAFFPPTCGTSLMRNSEKNFMNLGITCFVIN